MLDKHYDFNVIILTYNNIINTKKCLSSLYSHTSDFGLVIIDNGSDGEVVDFLKGVEKEHNNVIVKYNDSNTGVIRGRNQGYDTTLTSMMGSYYTIFLDSDQFVSKGWIDSYIEMMKRGYDIVGVEAWKMRDDFYPYGKLNKHYDGVIFNYVGCGGMMLRSFIIGHIGLFDDRFSPMFYEDPDLCFRAHKHGYKIGWNHSNKVIHAPHKLLGNSKRKAWFGASWKKFQDKWDSSDIPILG